jgi:proteasome activator subunit 4
MFKGLFRNFGSVLVDNFIDHLYTLIREKTKKEEGSHRVAAEIVAGMIRGSKHWTLEMVNVKEEFIEIPIDSFSSLMNFGKN